MKKPKRSGGKPREIYIVFWKGSFENKIYSNVCTMETRYEVCEIKIINVRR